MILFHHFGPLIFFFKIDNVSVPNLERTEEAQSVISCVNLVPEKWIPSYSEYPTALGQWEKNGPLSAKNSDKKVRAARWLDSQEMNIQQPLDSENCVSYIP